MGTWINSGNGWGWELNPLRMERWGWLWRKRVWEFRLVPAHALGFENAQGRWQPDRHEEETDLGSIPPPLRGWYPQDEFPLSYIFHDSACGHGGLWLRPPGAREYQFEALTRAEADRRLRDEWIPAEVALSGGSAWRRWPVWVGVRLGAACGAGRSRVHHEGHEGHEGIANSG